MKRIKQVFSNDQCAHVWAQQTQEKGRSGSTFFEGDSIYSYGYHYKTARIHTVKGKRVALINSTDTSMTTKCRHLPAVRNALSGLMPYFYASDVNDLKGAAKELTVKTIEYVESQFKRVKITSASDIKYTLENIKEMYAETNKLRALVGLKAISPPTKRIKELKAHFSARLKRYKELNTPEMIAKRDAGAEKRRADRDAAKTRETIRKAAEQIENFRSGQGHAVYGLPFEILRVKGDSVETSRGASVPLREALTLFKAVDRNKDVKGLTVGSFTVIGITPHLNADFSEDKVIQIGCHKVLLSEAKSVLGSLATPKLSLVS